MKKLNLQILHPATTRGHVSLFHLIVIGLSLTMTIGAWQISKSQIETRIETRFDSARDRALGLITERMEKYEDALWAGVSAISSHGGDVSHEQWRIFAEKLRIKDRYPGISGIGVIHYLTDRDMPAYMAARQAERPGYKIHPAHAEALYMPISFIEPEARNAAAVGLDVAHELNRRTGALASRDTGTAQITGPIVLVQDAGSTPGFLFYAPFYRGGHPASLGARKARFQGAVYAPFVVRELMAGALAQDLREVRFSITDAGQRIYDEHLADDPLYDPDPLRTDQVSLELYGRTWVLDVRSNLIFRAHNTYDQPTFILVAGLIIEALIIALLVLMSRANRRAVAYADRMTAALRRKTERLAQSNEELEQFAYVTSHDLKTPIRGIGGLTEMLQEDLEEYLASPGANPEVDLNLNRILDRVHRMDDLTRGVLEYSRVDTPKAGGTTLVLQEAIDALTSDFGLLPGQLALTGDIKVVCYDTFNLRRVLENLVGNAIKYHDGVQTLAICVSARAKGGRCEIAVQDNGPGIEPRFHGRIFDVFQTLRVGDAPESTGIGLSIVKKSVERHGGKITLDSTPGAGAKFCFDWPLADEVKFYLETGKAA
ncbi:MAG: CHASE domain-containing protein [Sulfitobacter sp.]